MTKVRTADLAAKLRDAAKLEDPHARMAVLWIERHIDDLKDKLVDASGDELLRVQGAVRHLQRMYSALTITPPTMQVAPEGR